MLTRTRLVIAALALSAFTTSIQPARAATDCTDPLTPHVSGRTKYVFAPETTDHTTTSQTFVDIPGAKIKFDVENSKQCAIIQFSGIFFIPGSENAFLQILLNEKKIAVPGPVIVAFNGDSDVKIFAFSHQFFTLTRLDERRHTIQAQFRTQGGNEINLTEYVFSVTY